MTKPEWMLVPKEIIDRLAIKPVETWAGVTARIKAVEDLRTFLAASPPAPSVPDVVRKWGDLFKEYGTNTPRSTRAKVIGDRMAAALGVSEANRTMWHDLAQERLGEMQRLESKVTAQAAEVERLTGEVERERTKFQGMLKAEHELSDAYIRLRVILGAMNPPSTMPTLELWGYVEGCASSLTASLETARGALVECEAQLATLRGTAIP